VRCFSVMAGRDLGCRERCNPKRPRPSHLELFAQRCCCQARQNLRQRAEFSSTTFRLLAPVIGVCRRDLVTGPSLRHTLTADKVLLASTADESLPFRLCQSPNKRRNWP